MDPSKPIDPENAKSLSPVLPVVLASEHRVNNLRWAIAGLTFVPVEPAIASSSKTRPVVGDRWGLAIPSVRLPAVAFGKPAHLVPPVQFPEDIQPA